MENFKWWEDDASNLADILNGYTIGRISVCAQRDPLGAWAYAIIWHTEGRRMLLGLVKNGKVLEGDSE